MRLIDTIRIVHAVFLITAAVTVYHVSLIYVSCLIRNLPILGALEKCSDYLVFPGCLLPD